MVRTHSSPYTKVRFFSVLICLCRWNSGMHASPLSKYNRSAFTHKHFQHWSRAGFYNAYLHPFLILDPKYNQLWPSLKVRALLSSCFISLQIVWEGDWLRLRKFWNIFENWRVQSPAAAAFSFWCSCLPLRGSLPLQESLLAFKNNYPSRIRLKKSACSYSLFIALFSQLLFVFSSLSLSQSSAFA